MIEEKYPEVQILFKVGKEKGYLLYEEVQTVLSDEVTGEPRDLEEVYTRFFDLGIEIVTDPDRAARKRAALLPTWLKTGRLPDSVRPSASRRGSRPNMPRTLPRRRSSSISSWRSRPRTEE